MWFPNCTGYQYFCFIIDFVSHVSGVIEELHENSVTVNFLQRNRNKLSWPKRADVQDVQLEDILCILTKAPVAESASNFKLCQSDDIDCLMLKARF